MDITFIIKGIAIGILVSVPVGPVAVLAIQRSLNKGFKSGFITGIGAASADIIYAIIAGFSITFISDFLIENQTYIRIIGGVFLVFIGYKIFTSNPAKQIRKHKTKGHNYYKDFLTSFFVTVSNPLTIIAFGAIFASFHMVNDKSASFSVIILIITVFSGALLWWVSLISIVTIFKNKIRLRNLLWINRITGLLIILFATLLIISSFIPEAAEIGTNLK